MGLIAPVSLFAISLAATSSGPVPHRFGLLLPCVGFATVLYLVPAIFVLVFVRLSGPYLVCLLAFCVAVPVALISIERSDSSTKGLLLLSVPYIASLAAIVGALVDATARYWLTRRGRPTSP